MKISKILTLTAIMALSVSANGADFKAVEGDWTLEIAEATGKLTISNKGVAVFNNAYAYATYNYVGSGTTNSIQSLDYGKLPEIKVTEVNDEFGAGKKYGFNYVSGDIQLTHSFSFYPSLPYMIVQASIKSLAGSEIQTNHIKALAIAESSTPIEISGTSYNRTVWVPFDNDGHLKYENKSLSTEVVSHEVGYVFNGESRKGLIAGSVDHDTWKSGVTVSGTGGYRIDKFECLSGLTNYYTRDALPHGKIKGTELASARYFVGLYDDWREGLNDFGDANTKVVPKAPWADGNPMGWSSWGVQQNYINYDGVVESAQFVKSLEEYGFYNKNGQTVISLDAFATDNISNANLYKLGTKVFGEGTYRDGLTEKEGTNQILGQYCGPLVVWSWTMDSKVQGTGLNGEPDYTGRDIALKVNGEPYAVTSNSGYAVDPTHPGVKANIEFFMKQFAANGTKYIKADFLNNGIIEGDSWYDPNITTGVQAYNYGMKLLYDEAAKYGMYIVESISPIFPYQYAHGRRTCCDRFSQIGETEYVMNSISYGWWTDRLYAVNDPDHLVMCKGGYNAAETEGENRARATSGMATGAFIFGDNFSNKVVYTDSNNGHEQGAVVGYPEESKARAMITMCNQDINEYVRNNTGSFMPIEGHKPSSSQSAESLFMRRTDDAVYVAVFNYNTVFSSNGTIALDRIGVAESEISEIKELWSGDIVELSDGAISYNVPKKDVKVFRIKLTSAGVDEVLNDAVADTFEVVRVGEKQFALRSSLPIASYSVYDVAGRCIIPAGTSADAETLINLCNLSDGMYLIYATFADTTTACVKIINK